ncbi:MULTISPECIES: YqcC family protein [unclassified Vibrio]|uniref:YqcC family protein n=1 Tax=Vibrio sp. HB236076 TaxID=3232307 RepID=A0AB39HEJ6_9VIBR|nr:YqcC family protein [Vibrio sp. HB161653]MDP5254865.1 YqcC family protein [Vibrio sp. HB161653]
MTTSDQSLSLLLTQLESALKEAQCWQVEPPSSEQMASQQPFSLDTLAPEAWLQWVFIPKLRALIDDKKPLPRGYSIRPYFEQSWQNDTRYQAILAVIADIDEVANA